MANLLQGFDVPIKSPMFERGGILTTVWASFYRILFERLSPLGVERIFDIVNNQSAAADVTAMRFDYRGASQFAVDYLIQRVTTSTGAVEKLETGVLLFVYKPTSDTWSKVTIGSSGPDVSGVTLSITALGQVQYTSTNVAGTAHISRIVWRARYLAGKHSSYSAVGTK